MHMPRHMSTHTEQQAPANTDKRMRLQTSPKPVLVQHQRERFKHNSLLCCLSIVMEVNTCTDMRLDMCVQACTRLDVPALIRPSSCGDIHVWTCVWTWHSTMCRHVCGHGIAPCVDMCVDMA